MATLPHEARRADAADEQVSHREGGGYWDVGAQVFTWAAWALAAAFWGLSLTTGIGILQGIGNAAGATGAGGYLGAGGLGWFLINVIGGFLILGLAIAYGVYRYVTRDRSKDPLTEASTAAVYDSAERGGGDDVISRSPEARRPEERHAFREARDDLR